MYFILAPLLFIEYFRTHTCLYLYKPWPQTISQNLFTVVTHISFNNKIHLPYFLRFFSYTFYHSHLSFPHICTYTHALTFPLNLKLPWKGLEWSFQRESVLPTLSAWDEDVWVRASLCPFIRGALCEA